MAGTRIYVYKLVADNGGAPCVHRGRLSLAICKPKIRRTAEKGAFVVGFGGKRLGGRLIYAAKVTDRLDAGEYYSDSLHADRPDCIYRQVDGRAEIKDRARYHSTGAQLQRDVGRHFEHSTVLLSDDFLYFGSKGTRDFELNRPVLVAMLGGLRQGHRVNHSPSVQAELESLLTELWTRPKLGAIGRATDGDCTLRCNQDRE